MKTSQIVVKIVLRVFFLLLCFGLASYFFSFGAFTKGNSQDATFSIRHSWTLIYPGLLAAGFIALLVIALRNKYSKPDLNWLLVLNTIILMAYCITLYIKMYEVLNPAG